MLVDIPAVVEQLALLAVVAGVLFAVKIALVSGTVLALGGLLGTAVISGLSLAQIGEFSFLLSAVGLPLGLFREGDYRSSKEYPATQQRLFRAVQSPRLDENVPSDFNSPAGRNK